MLVLNVTTPDEGSILRPAGVAVNEPAEAPVPKLGVSVPAEPAQLLPVANVKAADGAVEIVTVVELLAAQVPATAYVMVYVPMLLVARLIAPVLKLKLRPLGVAEKVPPAWPAMVGVGLVPVWQKVPPE